MAKGKTWEEKLDEAWSNLPMTPIIATLLLTAAVAYLLHLEIVSIILVTLPLIISMAFFGIILFLPVTIYLLYRGITRKHREAGRKIEETHELTRKIIDKRAHSTFDKDGNLVKMQ
jgi:hypothetical protein